MTNFLLSTEIIPLCLRTMEMGSELSKTVATFIVQKILLDEVGFWRLHSHSSTPPAFGTETTASSWSSRHHHTAQVGLSYICATPERCYAVGAVLANMVTTLVCFSFSFSSTPYSSTPLLRNSVRDHSNCALSPADVSVFCVRSHSVHPSRPHCPGAQQEQPSVRLLKHIIRCYLRLSDNAKCAAAPAARWPPAEPLWQGGIAAIEP